MGVWARRAAVLAAGVLTGCSAPVSPGAPAAGSPVPGTGEPSSTPSSAATSPPPAGASSCRPGDPLQGIYHPLRLRILRQCQEAAGTVLGVIREQDGDLHIWLAPDAPYAGLLNSYNRFAGQPALVVEISPACAGQPASSEVAAKCPPSPLRAPAAGNHVQVVGPWVEDDVHDWREIHPVNTIAFG